MKRFAPFSVLIIGVFMVMSCDSEPLAGPESSLDQHRVFGRASSPLVVMSRNLYVGTDDDAVVAALASPDPNDDFPALIQAIQTFGNTYYPARAAAVADEIARARPHAVGLQEVSQVVIQLPALPGLLDEPVDIDVDFLPILLYELSARNLNYVLAEDSYGNQAYVSNYAAAPPLPIPGAVVSLVDNDALLIDADRVSVDSAWGQNFEYGLGPVAPGVDLINGWVGVVAEIDEEVYTIVSTHLAAGHDLPIITEIRAAQTMELLDSLGAAAPAIVMGDLNDWVDTPMHQLLGAAGFTDVWAALRPGTRGYTCCHVKDLSSSVAQFYERIDYIWTRGIGHPKSGLQGQVTRTGMLPFTRVDGPAYKIWPSDHAGLVARVRTSARTLFSGR